MNQHMQAEKERVLRSAMGRSVRSGLAATSSRLRTAADRIAALEEDVDRIGLPPKAKGQRPVTADGILAEVLLILHSNAPDLGTLARSVEEYNRDVSTASSHPEDKNRCTVLYATARCTAESVPGARVCFSHLWQTAAGHGSGYVFPLGSPEPSEKAVPCGVVLIAENGVHWTRHGDRWHAGGPVGDGGFYTWGMVNGSGNETGRELAQLLPVVMR
jgi:hypothetical protein